jgi:ADP-dependent NAD(P)H-hydrate dehydratase / NAD(P)H-hydrate epimerase
MKLATVAEMVAIEKEADAAGLTYESMMENAGRGLAGILRSLESGTSTREVAGLVGPGNNGGDALVALAELSASGWHATAYLVRRSDDPLVNRLRKAGGRILTDAQDDTGSQLTDLLRNAAVILDGLLGTGAKPPARGEIAVAMARTNATLAQLDSVPYIVAVDCPSGVDCDTGEASPECIPADLTVTMAAVKQGLLRLPAYDYVGGLEVVDIGLPVDLPGLASLSVEVANAQQVARTLPQRPSDSHKGTFGTAIVVAGSVNYTGAAMLSGSAAYRVGAGLVTMAVPSVLHSALAGHLPDATWLLLPHEMGVIAREAATVLAAGMDGCTAMLLGPGFGTENTTADFLQRLFAGQSGPFGAGARMGFVGASEGAPSTTERRLPPLVVDADGLKLLAQQPDWSKRLPPESVLTPHPGEMAVLTGLSKDDIQRNRLSLAIKYARAWGQVVVLKGAFSVIAAPDGQATVIPVATSALAHAGTGDVLAGLIVGLRAQGVGSYEAAVAGAWIHAQAGLDAASRLGNEASVLASDVLASVVDVISDLQRG